MIGEKLPASSFELNCLYWLFLNRKIGISTIISGDAKLNTFKSAKESFHLKIINTGMMLLHYTYFSKG